MFNMESALAKAAPKPPSETFVAVSVPVVGLLVVWVADNCESRSTAKGMSYSSASSSSRDVDGGIAEEAAKAELRTDGRKRLA